MTTTPQQWTRERSDYLANRERELVWELAEVIVEVVPHVPSYTVDYYAKLVAGYLIDTAIELNSRGKDGTSNE
jgi:hypothetical protein